MTQCPICRNKIDECACTGCRCNSCGQYAGSEASVHKLMHAMRRNFATSGNYVADREASPTKVTFTNGRIVRIVKGALVVEWAKNKEKP